MARSKTIETAVLNKSAGVLLEIGKLFSLPTVLSAVPEGAKAPELIFELRDSGFAQEKPRVSVSPFGDEQTKTLLAASKRNVLIIGGFATEAVVLHAVLDARSEGYEVLVPVDVCGGMSERTEQAALGHIIAAGAITTSVVSIATKLLPDFTTDQGKELFKIVQKLRLA